MSETNESKMKVVGKSAAAVNRVVDILRGWMRSFRFRCNVLNFLCALGSRTFRRRIRRNNRMPKTAGF